MDKSPVFMSDYLIGELSSIYRRKAETMVSIGYLNIQLYLTRAGGISLVENDQLDQLDNSDFELSELAITGKGKRAEINLSAREEVSRRHFSGWKDTRTIVFIWKNRILLGVDWDFSLNTTNKLDEISRKETGSAFLFIEIVGRSSLSPYGWKNTHVILHCQPYSPTALKMVVLLSHYEV